MKKNIFHKKSILLISCLGFWLLSLLPALALADNTAVIKNIKLANTRDDLLTYFDVKKAFTKKINQEVLNGIPTTFTFYVTLYKTQGTWFDKKISDIHIQSTLKYNSLKKEFSISRPWKEENAVIVKTFDQARSMMTEVDNLKIVTLDKLSKGEKYQLRIKAKLDIVTLPLSLHKILGYISFWDFETNWYLINFTY